MPANLVKYQATDGVEVQITPADIAAIVTGGAQLTDAEAVQVMAKCQSRGLNPLAGDVHVIKYKDSASIIVSKDYFLRTASQMPTFQGLKAGVVVANKQTGELTYREGTIVGKNSESLVGGWAEVFDSRLTQPMRAEVAFSEYNTGKSLWTSKPATMIRKVALVQALRECFPGSCGGIYDADEMPEAPSAPTAPAQAQPVEPVAVEPVVEEAPISVDPSTGEIADADLYESDVEF